jgi:DNA-binding MarR family transcriptional regulator
LTFDGLVTATYIVQVTINDCIERDSVADGRSGDHHSPGDGFANDHLAASAARAALLNDISAGVVVLASRRRCAAARRIHHSGISLGHLQVLWILQEHGPLPVSRLADWLGIGVPNVTGLLDRMEQRGLVERARDGEDRRVVLASASDLGRAAVAEHDGWPAEVLAQLLAPLTIEQLAAVADGVRVTCAAASAAAPGATAPTSVATAPPPHPQPSTLETGAPAR